MQSLHLVSLNHILTFQIMKGDIYRSKMEFTLFYLFIFKYRDMSFAMYNADANPGFFQQFLVLTPEHILAVFLTHCN